METEFNLQTELEVENYEEIFNLESDVMTFYFEESIDLSELDSSIYEIGSPDGIYASSGLRDPKMISKNEQKDIFESIFQGIDENLFNRINQLTGKFVYLHGQGLLGTLGGVIDLVVGILDLVGITDDLISGITGFLSGGNALNAGVQAVLGAIFGNGRVNEAIKKGSERSNKFVEDTSKRVAQIQEAETDILTQGDGNKSIVITGTKSETTGRSVIHANTTFVAESPLMQLASDTTLINNKTTKQISDLFSLQAQHVDYTIDDSLIINSNVFSTTANNRREVSRTHVSNSEETEIIASSTLHLQGGTYGGSPFSVGESIVEEEPMLSLSCTKNIYVYAGRDYYLTSKNIYSIDSRVTLVNMGGALVSTIMARPRQIVKVTPLSNPPSQEVSTAVENSITIAEGNQIPISSGLSNKTYNTNTLDKFLA